MRRATKKEKSTIVPELFEELFGTWDDNIILRTVILHEDVGGEIDGFVAGFFMDKTTFWLQWGGKRGGFVGAHKFWQESEKELRDMGIRWIRTKVFNTQTDWQRVLMKMNWIPIGTSIHDNSLVIEYVKNLEGEEDGSI